jgi:DNA-binding transcriptional MerR regulator
MVDSGTDDLISSKDVLRITGISRATLNNYIKMGILPRPLVGKGREDMKGVKIIGYFPLSVLDRIDTVKRLKGEGLSIDEIARQFRGDGEDVPDQPLDTDDWEAEGKEDVPEGVASVGEKALALTLEDFSFPSYLLNFNFEVVWINELAEQKIFKQSVDIIRDPGARSIFKLLFNWEFHNLVKNWKDLMTCHMSYAKTKFSKTWIPKLYKGISRREIDILEEIYEKVSPTPQEGIKMMRVNLLLRGGTTEPYRVFSMFFREGILFVFEEIKGL